MNNDWQIPSVEQEQAITTFAGHPLKFPAKHARFEHLWPSASTDEISERDRRAIDLYLANFCEPIKAVNNQVRCVGCGTELLNPQHPAFVMRGVDINPHDEFLDSKCPSCAYPVRCRHKIHDLDNNRLLVYLDFFPMCFHPLTLSYGDEE